MNNSKQVLVELFKQKCSLVSTVVIDCSSMAELVEYSLNICIAKQNLQPLLPDSGEKSGSRKIIAAPSLALENYQSLASLAEKNNISVLKSGLRKHLTGIDVALTCADMGIANTATCVFANADEEFRLATMICEIHVVALSKSQIVQDLLAAEEYLRQCLNEKAMYLAFISGCSRTSDIERVLTLGVHGPLELHVALLDN